MVAEKRRRRVAGWVEPGDGHALAPYQWWQSFSRSLFHLRLMVEGDASEIWSVDVRHGGDSNGEVRAHLYRNGRSCYQSRLPAAFPVPGGAIEVVASGYGLKRCHYVTTDRVEQQLVPDPASAEGRRARFEHTHPALSRVIALTSVIVLVIALVLWFPQIVEQITQFPPIAERIGTFVSPLFLPAWVNVSLLLAALVASTERALRLRHNKFLDGGIFDGDD